MSYIHVYDIWNFHCRSLQNVLDTFYFILCFHHGFHLLISLQILAIPWSSFIAYKFSFQLLFQSQISFAAYGHIFFISLDYCIADFITFVLSSHLLFSFYLRFHDIFSIYLRYFIFLPGSITFFISFHIFSSFYDRVQYAVYV